MLLLPLFTISTPTETPNKDTSPIRHRMTRHASNNANKVKCHDGPKLFELHLEKRKLSFYELSAAEPHTKHHCNIGFVTF